MRLNEMQISTDLENRKILRVFFHFISCQAETKIVEVHQEIVALKHCTATESAVLYPIPTVNKASLVHCLGVGLCVDLGSFWVSYLGEPQIWIDSKGVCVEADAFSVLLGALIPAQRFVERSSDISSGDTSALLEGVSVVG